MKPKVRFLNYIHKPVIFHPVEWCITQNCARMFYRRNSREGKLLLNADTIWGWKEHASSMQIFFNNYFLADYQFDHLESVQDLICMHFDRHLDLKHPPMPDFKWDVENGFKDSGDGLPDEKF